MRKTILVRPGDEKHRAAAKKGWKSTRMVGSLLELEFWDFEAYIENRAMEYMNRTPICPELTN